MPSLALARRLFSMQEVSWTLRKGEDFKQAKALGNLCIFEGFLPAKDEETPRAFQEVFLKKSAAPVTCQTNTK